MAEMNLRKHCSCTEARTNNSVVGILIWRTDKQTEKSIFSSMFYSGRGLRSRRCTSGTNGPQIHGSLSYHRRASCDAPLSSSCLHLSKTHSSQDQVCVRMVFLLVLE